MTTAKKHTIIYAEDDLDDLLFIQEAFSKYTHCIDLIHAANGVEALTVLNQLSEKKSLPCLVILDINMPLKDGRQTLISIKQSTELKDIPIVLFTTSGSQLDQAFALRWGADFVTKPIKVQAIENLAQEFAERCGIKLSSTA